MINPDQLREYVIRPVLKTLDLYSQQAEELLLLTAAHESKLGYFLHQVGGPALGIYQCEPATHDDCWTNFLAYKPKLAELVREWGGSAETMTGNLFYATAIARCQYLRDPEPLPFASDVRGMANYWKRVWNTSQGRGTPDQAFDAYKRFVEHA